MAKIKGNGLLLYLDGQVIGCTDNCEFNSENEAIDSTCKDNDGAKQVEPGGNTATFSFSGKWEFTSTLGPQQLYAIHNNKQRIGVKMAVADPVSTNESSGYPYIQAYGYLNQLSIVGPLNQAATFSGRVDVDGPHSMGTTT